MGIHIIDNQYELQSGIRFEKEQSTLCRYMLHGRMKYMIEAFKNIGELT